MKRLFEILNEQYEKHLEIIDTLEKKEFQFTPALQQLVEEGFKLKSAIFEEGILDFGRPEALLNSNRILLDAMFADYQKQKKNMDIIDSVIINPSVIDFGTKIKKCGFVAILFKGKSSSPKIIVKIDGHKEILDASEIWGLDLNETDAKLKKKADRLFKIFEDKIEKLSTKLF